MKYFLDITATTEGDGKSWKSPFKTIQYAQSVVTGPYDVLYMRNYQDISSTLEITKFHALIGASFHSTRVAGEHWLLPSLNFVNFSSLSDGLVLNATEGFKFKKINLNFNSNNIAVGIKQQAMAAVEFDLSVISFSILPEIGIQTFNPPVPQGGQLFIIRNSMLGYIGISATPKPLIQDYGEIVIDHSVIILGYNIYIKEVQGYNVYPVPSIVNSIFLVLYDSAAGQNWNDWNWIVEEYAPYGITFLNNSYIALDFATRKLTVLTGNNLPVGAINPDPWPRIYKLPIKEPIVYTPSPDPELCRIHVFAVDLNLEPVSGVEVEVGYDVPERVGDKLGVSRKKVYVTDATGYTFFDAPRNVSLIVRIEKAGILQAIKVPDAPFANIADLLRL